MKARVLLAALVSAVGLVGGTAAPAAPAYLHGSPAAVEKACSSGYTHAIIGGVHKCLRAGQFCAHRYDAQYRRYGYRCIRYDRRVSRYRLTHA